MSRKIVITSGKGGVGKTTVTAHLGYYLARSGERVVAVDGDLGLNNLDVAMGAEGKISYDIFDCLNGRCRVKQAVVQSQQNKNLYLLPACFGKNPSSVDVGRMKNIIDELGRSFDYVLLDCPAGVDESFRRAVCCTEEAIVVITPHISSIRDADKVIGLITNRREGNVGLVVNKMRGDLAASGDMLMPEDISALLKVSLIGVIPEDDGIVIGKGESGDAKRAFKILADNVRLNKRKIFDCTARYVGFSGSIRRKLKKFL